jgi:hypothetical protein
MSKWQLVLAISLVNLAACQPVAEEQNYSGISFEVSFSAALTEENQDGRLLLMLSTLDDSEPRFHVDNFRSGICPKFRQEPTTRRHC